MLQYTDIGDCFAEGRSTSVDVVEIAAAADCPHELIRHQVAMTLA